MPTPDIVKMPIQVGLLTSAAPLTGVFSGFSHKNWWKWWMCGCRPKWLDTI